MNKIRLTLLAAFLLATLFFNQSASAEDTTFVRSHFKGHWNWYGSLDSTAVFPDASHRYRKIILKYTLGCPSGGCSDWDYTTQIQVMHKTGLTDSSIVQYPSFLVDGTEVDSIHYSSTPTYTYFWDAADSSLDSTANAGIQILVFGDSLHPQDTTASLTGYAGDYYNYIYDSLGAIVDSFFVANDTSLYLVHYPTTIYFPQVKPIELARLMTPYGGNFNSTWTNVYYFDITDYAPVLRDSVMIRAFYSGWSDGYTVTLDFMLIEGIPPRDAFAVENLWDGYFNYGDDNDPIENHLTPKTVYLPTHTGGAMVRIYPSGHGADNQVCSEFCAKEYYLKVNGTQHFSQLIWRDDCGKNPMWPQPGTWLYDRAGWCPGSKTISYDHEITPYYLPGDFVSIGMDMEAYLSSGGAGYQISGNLFEFEAPNFINDATMEDIISPNKRFDGNRVNPICANPKVLIRNTGSATLTSCTIKYGCVGAALLSYTWTGNLPFLASQEVTLPNAAAQSFWLPYTFIAYVENPNGVTDQQHFNDTLRSNFNPPPIYGSEIVVNVKTNSNGFETTYDLTDHNGNVILSRSGLANNTTYKDTFNLPVGCYQFHLKDAGCDGLSWWANAAQGSGTAKLNKVNPPNAVNKTFTSDFGCEIIHNFTVGYFLGKEELSLEEELNVFPNPSNGIVNIDLVLNKPEDVVLVVYDAIGRVVLKQSEKNYANTGFTVDLEKRPKGMYLVQLRTATKNFTKRILVN